MAAIDVGSAAVTRTFWTGDTETNIDYNNAADGNGTITEVQIFVHVQLNDGIEIGIFIDEGGGDFSTRDNEFVAGVYASGYHELVVDLDVQVGDFIGAYCPSGSLKRDTTGGAGRYYLAGDNIPCTSVTFTLGADDIVSIYGIGATANGGPAAPTSAGGGVTSVLIGHKMI